MGEHRRSYPEELKRSALDLLRTSRKSAAAMAKDLGIDSGLLNRWRREEAQESGSRKAFTGQGVPRDEEVAQLRREVSDLREANDILKKSRRHLLREGQPEMTLRFIDAHRTRWSVERMARVLEVSTSGYYAWKHRKPSR